MTSFTAERARIAGALQAGSDAQDARFFTMSSFEAVDKEGFEAQLEPVAAMVVRAAETLAWRRS